MLSNEVLDGVQKEKVEKSNIVKNDSGNARKSSKYSSNK